MNWHIVHICFPIETKYRADIDTGIIPGGTIHVNFFLKIG